jgi:acetylornithine deacetylase/succinyl-diaminopimelate desuccinylase-like protein
MESEIRLDELRAWLEIPSVSADPAHANDVVAAAEWLCDFVRNAGGNCELVPQSVGGPPLVIGEIRASSNAEDAPTVMVYGHFDVQPPAPLERWDSEPFVPTVRDGWLYARGVADNKGQLYMVLRAAADLAAEGALPVNVRFCCDGEEEVGGHAIVDFLERDERGADVCVIFDFPTQEGKPAFMVATRGMAYFHLTVRTGARDLHSGIFGGVALNALHALVAGLAPLLARDGRVPEPLRAGITPVTDEEAAGWTTLRPGSDELSDSEVEPMDALAVDDFYVRSWAEPTVEINGIDGGESHLQKTVLPVQAEANVSLRLAPGQDIDQIVASFEQLLRAALPAGARLELDLLSASPPARIDPASKAIQLGLTAFERATGERPLLIRAGGSLPMAPALVERGIPAIMTGFIGPDSNAHSPNEGMPLEALRLGTKAARELLVALGEL